MNYSRMEAIWLARAVRFLGFKELFDAITNLWVLFTKTCGYGPTVGQGTGGGRELFWAVVSLTIAVPLLRWADTIARLCIGPSGSRKMARVLNVSDSFWLSVSIRVFGVCVLLRGVGTAGEGFLYSAADTRMLAATPSSAGIYYSLWTLLYIVTGCVLSRRPDVLGLLLITNPGPNQRPQGTPENEPSPSTEPETRIP